MHSEAKQTEVLEFEAEKGLLETDGSGPKKPHTP